MPGHHQRVLIVDDDKAVREALEFALRLQGFCVRVYSGGQELLAGGDLDTAGCVIVDDRMPDMDGLELIDQLRRRAIPVPAILMTSHVTDRLQAQAAVAGVQVVLEKPFLENALAASIQTILGAPDCLPGT
ncbi:response regulator transcription factor [Rhodopila sp.]|jgi:FixJ family two-component response regulator|uniref:response regulator transcription factor n=1 Tax=Rhodopila sp. TaxID=2480087 RepID=UPI002C2A88AA|nr:response regulator [Rhodopila sp.]HVZ08195.1 response regulator [Rhodopila sp.]